VLLAKRELERKYEMVSQLSVNAILCKTSSIKNLMITPEFQANCVDTVGENEPADEMAVDAVFSEPVSE
jgi:hypothetical protein